MRDRDRNPRERCARAEPATPLHVLRLVLVELDQLARRLDGLEQRFAEATT